MRIRIREPFLWLALLFAACQSSTPTPPVQPTNLPTAFPQPTLARAPSLTVTPAFQALPAGSTARFGLAIGSSCQAERYAFDVDEMPLGWTAEFLGSPTPCTETLVVEQAGSTQVGRYRIRVTATSQTGLSASAELTVEVMPCVEFQTGEFSQAISANLVALTTAGKPAVEHGLLVPLQVCEVYSGRRLQVTLLEVLSETRSRLTEPPRFYLYRSWVWPEPNGIMAHGVPETLNVALPRVENKGWQLEADITPGLYLLVLERDYYGSSTDPQAIPAFVTFRLKTQP